MYYFLVRIELHNAGLLDYNILHQSMEAFGFKRTIVGDNGVEYHLPTAEYILQGNYTFESILGCGNAAIAKTKTTGMVLVTRADSLRWNNLTPVKK